MNEFKTQIEKTTPTAIHDVEIFFPPLHRSLLQMHVSTVIPAASTSSLLHGCAVIFTQLRVTRLFLPTKNAT